jgi:hypothetical protein
MVDFDERSHIADLDVGSDHAHHEPGHHWEQRLTGVAADATADIAVTETSNQIDALLEQFQEGGDGATIVASEGVSSEVRGAAVRETLQRYGASVAGSSLANEGLQAWIKERAPIQTATVAPKQAPEQKQDQAEPFGIADSDSLAEGVGIEQPQGTDLTQDQGLQEPLSMADELPVGIDADIRESMSEGLQAPLAAGISEGMENPLAQDQAVDGLQGIPAGIEAHIRESIDIEEPLATQQEQPLADVDSIPSGIDVDLRQGVDVAAGIAGAMADGAQTSTDIDTPQATDTRIGQATALDRGAQIQPGVDAAISQELPPNVEFQSREAVAMGIEAGPDPLSSYRTGVSQEVPSGVVADLRVQNDLDIAPEADTFGLPEKYQDLPPGMIRFFKEKMRKEELELN